MKYRHVLVVLSMALVLSFAVAGCKKSVQPVAEQPADKPAVVQPVEKPAIAPPVEKPAAEHPEHPTE